MVDKNKKFDNQLEKNLTQVVEKSEDLLQTSLLKVRDTIAYEVKNKAPEIKKNISNQLVQVAEESKKFVGTTLTNICKTIDSEVQDKAPKIQKYIIDQSTNQLTQQQQKLYNIQKEIIIYSTKLGNVSIDTEGGEQEYENLEQIIIQCLKSEKAVNNKIGILQKILMWIQDVAQIADDAVEPQSHVLETADPKTELELYGQTPDS
jgi:hypothetical protein